VYGSYTNKRPSATSNVVKNYIAYISNPPPTIELKANMEVREPHFAHPIMYLTINAEKDTVIHITV